MEHRTHHLVEEDTRPVIRLTVDIRNSAEGADCSLAVAGGRNPAVAVDIRPAAERNHRLHHADQGAEHHIGLVGLPRSPEFSHLEYRMSDRWHPL